MIRKKGWFSDLEILEIWGQENCKEYEQDTPTWTKTLSTEKQEPSNRIEKQNTVNRKATDLRTTKQMLTHEDKINVELKKKIMTET